MSYMESAMQDQIDGSIALQNQICDDACDVYKKTHLMASDLLKQRAELLKALKTMTGLCAVKYGNLDPDVWAEIQKSQDLIANAEK